MWLMGLCNHTWPLPSQPPCMIEGGEGGRRLSLAARLRYNKDYAHSGILLLYYESISG